MQTKITWPIIFLVTFSGVLLSQENTHILRTVRIVFVDEQGNSLHDLHVEHFFIFLSNNAFSQQRGHVNVGRTNRFSPDTYKEAARNEDGTFHQTLWLRMGGNSYFHVLSAQTADKRLGGVFRLPLDPGEEPISVTLTPIPKATMKVVSSVDGEPLRNKKLEGFRLCFECSWRDDAFTPFFTDKPWGPLDLETDENGIVTFDGILPGGIYELQTYSDPRFFPKDIVWRIEANTEDTELDLGTIEYYPGSGQSQGFEALVLDERGEPVSDAMVSIGFTVPPWTGKTDENGRVKGFLQMFHDSQQNYFRPVMLLTRSPDGTGVQSQPLHRSEPEVTIRLRPPVTITGQVIDKESRKPIPNVPVLFRGTCWMPDYWNGHFVTTGELGCFQYKMFPGAKFTFQLHKVISEVDPEYRVSMDAIYTKEAGVGESLDLGVFERNAHLWKITADDRFYEAVVMEKIIPRLDKRLEEMCERSTKSGRNVLLHFYSFGAQNPYLNTLSQFAGNGQNIFGLFESFEFVTLHTPEGFSPESRTFQGLQWITGQELQPDVFAIIFSADGDFLGMCNFADVNDSFHDGDGNVVGWSRNAEKLGRFLEQFVPKR